MIGQVHRFHGYGSLNGVYRRGKTLRTQWISLRYAHGNPHKPYRVAVVVSRKVSKSAVVRNRVRRRVYEAVRTTGQDAQSGTDMIFTVFDERVAKMDAVQLRSLVGGLLKKPLESTTERA